MDSIDDDWEDDNSEQPSAVTPCPAQPSAPPAVQAKQASNPPSPGTGRFSSPLGLRSPANASPSVSPPSAATEAAPPTPTVNTEPEAKTGALPSVRPVSKVQAVAEAYRQHSGGAPSPGVKRPSATPQPPTFAAKSEGEPTRDTKPEPIRAKASPQTASTNSNRETAPSAKVVGGSANADTKKVVIGSGPNADAKPTRASEKQERYPERNRDLDTATAPQPAVVVSPVIAIEETLDLQEIPAPSAESAAPQLAQLPTEHRIGISDVPPPLPDEARFASADDALTATPPVVTESASAPHELASVTHESGPDSLIPSMIVEVSPVIPAAAVVTVAAPNRLESKPEPAKPTQPAKSEPAKLTEAVKPVEAAALAAKPVEAAALAAKLEPAKSAGSPEPKLDTTLGSPPVSNDAKGEPATDIKRGSSSDLRESASLRAAHARPSSNPNLGDTRPSQGALSLDAGYAVEFFSNAPPPSRPSEIEILPDFDHHSLRHVRSEEQLARQAYLRGVVLKVMLIAIVFVAIVVFILWHRGLLRVAG